MTIEIKVGPPVITISQGRTFMVTDQRGFINTDSDEGVYAIDTRFISFYHIYINRVPWNAVSIVVCPEFKYRWGEFVRAENSRPAAYPSGIHMGDTHS